jgi:hypothetical protein
MTALICIAIICVLIGFVCGSIRTVAVLAPGALIPDFQLSDTALAHITHEAIRAYERSLGVIKQKTWNNLTEAEREAKAAAVDTFRYFEGQVEDAAMAIAVLVAGLSD